MDTLLPQTQLPSKLVKENKIASIDILPNAAIITYKESNGLTRIVKTVKLESLIKAFQSTDTKLSSPILPSNCIRYEEKGNSVVIILLHEQTRFTATCFGKIYENVLRPNLIMKYTLHKRGETYSIGATDCFAIADDPMLISTNTQLYGMPFPNISPSGWICWGNNSIAGNFRSLTGLKVYVERLFKAPFNDHVFNSQFLKNFDINGPAQLFELLQQESDRFPNQILENLGRQFTLGSI